MTDELKQLIEDAAKLLGYPSKGLASQFIAQGVSAHAIIIGNSKGGDSIFNPLDPERGDLMKVAEAAELVIRFNFGEVYVITPTGYELYEFTKGDHDSKALAILRAASAVLRAREGEKK